MQISYSYNSSHQHRTPVAYSMTIVVLTIRTATRMLHVPWTHTHDGINWTHSHSDCEAHTVRTLCDRIPTHGCRRQNMHKILLSMHVVVRIPEP